MQTMTIFTEAMYNKFAEFDGLELCRDLHKSYDKAIVRRVHKILLPKADASPVEQAKFCCQICCHALLHRSSCLFEASMLGVLHNNIHSTVACIRGHLEATASMGHACKKILSLTRGAIGLEAFHEDLAYQVLGSRSIALSRPSTNVLTMIKNADRVINEIIFDGEERDILSNCYNYLSEFAHPNFHSYSLSIRIDTGYGHAIIPYDILPNKEDFSLIGYIDISNGIFLELFDCFVGHVAHIEG